MIPVPTGTIDPPKASSSHINKHMKKNATQVPPWMKQQTTPHIAAITYQPVSMRKARIASLIPS